MLLQKTPAFSATSGVKFLKIYLKKTPKKLRRNVLICKGETKIVEILQNGVCYVTATDDFFETASGVSIGVPRFDSKY